jgi:hypothetical protein
MWKLNQKIMEKLDAEEAESLKNEARWFCLMPLAIEMGFTHRKLSMMLPDWEDLRKVLVIHYRERIAMLKIKDRRLKELAKQNEMQRQIVMDFHLENQGKKKL